MIASRQWASRPKDQRYQTLAALLAYVESRRNLSRTSDIALSKVSAVVEQDNGQDIVVLNHGMQAVEPSHWAFGQMAGVVKAPAAYLRDLSPKLVADNLNFGIAKHAAEVGDRKFMTLQDPNGNLNTLQAVTSTSYGRIWDADVTKAVIQMNEKTGNKFFNPKAYDVESGGIAPSGLYASDRDVFIFMIDGGSRLEVGPRAKLNRGFIMGNSEVGSKTCWLMTFLFNEVCGNHIIWGAQDVRTLSIRHTTNGPDRFLNEATPALLEYVNSKASDDEAMIHRAIEFLIPVADDKESTLIEWVMSKGKFSRGEVKDAILFAKAEEGDCKTLWQLVQGFTASARAVSWIDARLDLETRGSSLLKLVSGQ